MNLNFLNLSLHFAGDIVIVVVMEDKKEGTAPKEPFSKAVTILYSEAPYSTWTLLVKTGTIRFCIGLDILYIFAIHGMLLLVSVSFFDNATNEIQSLKSIFFNHERSHFDGVLELWQRGTVSFIHNLPTCNPDIWKTDGQSIFLFR